MHELAQFPNDLSHFNEKLYSQGRPFKYYSTLQLDMRLVSLLTLLLF